MGRNIVISQSGYIKGIDGIRALAVLLVIFFHVRIDLFQGGYIGVDVFFVISGFLITRLICKESALGKFSFRGFYARRIRRLVPALFVTCAGTFIYASVFLPPTQLADIAKSAIAAIFSFSNFIFLFEVDYFNAYSPRKHLLHTWSLGVEEQFYLFWPALIIAILTFKKKHLLIAIIIIWILSFVASLLLIQTHPNVVFYMTPFRIWEFATGALLIFVGSQKGQMGSLLSLLGFISIVFCAVLYNTDTSFPGLAALIPCLGAAAMIVGSESKFSLLTFDNHAAKLIGRTSYSLYLVHWPIIVIWLMHYKSISDSGTLILLSITFALGFVLHFVIETPFRYKKKGKDIFSRPAAFVAMPTFLIVITALGHAMASGGWSWRAEKDLRSYFAKTENLRSLLRHGECFQDRAQTLSDLPEYCYKPRNESKNVLIVGTSTAADLYPGILREFNDWEVFQVTRAHCYPIANIKEPEFCQSFNKFVFEELISNGNFDLVVISGLRYSDVKRHWNETAPLLQNADVDYVVVGPRPWYRLTPEFLIWEHGKSAGLDQYIYDHQRFAKSYEDVINDPYHYFSVQDAMCVSAKNCIWQIDGELLYSDQLHFSEAGSIYIAKHLKNWYENTRSGAVQSDGEN